MRLRISLLLTLMFVIPWPCVRGLTNSVKMFTWGADYGAVNAATGEAVLSRGKQLIFGYDFGAFKTNWTFRPAGAPDRVAVSTDGSMIFINLSRSNGVLQVTSAARDTVRFTRLVFSNITYSAVALMPIPGQPNSLVVACQRAGAQTSRLIVLDAGVPRPNIIDNVTSSQIYDGKLYCHIGSQTRVAEISPDGLQLNNQALDFSGRFCLTPDSIIFQSSGLVYARDTLQLRDRLGYSNVQLAPVAFPDAGRLFIWSGNTYTMYDLETLRITGTFSTPAPPILELWTENLALNERAILLLGPSRVGLVEPMSLSAVPKADLGIRGAESIEPAPRGAPLTISLAVTNRGPAIATNVIVTNLLSSGASQNVTISQGTIVSKGSRIIVNFGNVPAGGEATMQFTLNPNPGSFTLDNNATVVAENPDPDEADNRTAVYTRMADSGSVSGRDTALTALAIGYAPTTKKLWATLDSRAGKAANSLVEIDPATTETLRTINLHWVAGGLMTLSGDDQFAFVNRAIPNVIARIDLSSGSREQASIPGTVTQITRVPGTDQTFVILTSQGVYVYDGLIARPNSIPPIVSGAIRAEEIFFVDAKGLRQAYIDDSGLTLGPATHSPLAEVFGYYEAHDRRLLTSTGMAIDTDTGAIVRGNRAYAAVAVVKDQAKAFYAMQEGGAVVVEDADQQVELTRVSWPRASSLSEFIVTADGLGAIQTSSKLLIARAPEFGPHPPVDLSIIAKALTPAVVGEALQYEITIQNESGIAASNVVVMMTGDANVTVAGSNLPTGTALESGNLFTWQIDSIEAAGSLVGIVTVIPQRAGQLSSHVAVACNSPDLTPANNRVDVRNYAEIHSAPDTQFQLLVGTSSYVYVPSRGTFLASPPPGSPPGALEIDPLTARVAPYQMALPAATSLQLLGSQNLLALVNANRTALIFDLRTGLEMARINLPEPASDLRALPGSSQSFAAAMPNQTLLYDGMVPRSQPGLAYSTIAFSEDGQSLYGFDGYFNLQPVTATGLAAPTTRSGAFLNGGYMAFESQSNLVFSTRAQVIDLAREKWATSFGDVLNMLRLVPDLGAGRVYVMGGDRLYMYDAQTHRGLQTNYYPNGLTGSLQFSRWGGDGLAVRADESILLMRSSQIGTAAEADLAIDLRQSSRTASNITYQITVTNRSTVDAANATARLFFPADWLIVSSPEGSLTSSGVLVLNERRLNAGASFTAEATFQTTAGNEVVRAQVATDARESVTWNNWSATLKIDASRFNLDEPVNIPVSAVELYVATNRTIALITGLAAGPGLDCRLLTLDAFTGELQAISPFLGFEPNKLAHSDDGHYAYVGIATTGIIHRINLREGNRIEQTVQLPGPTYAYDMTGVPGEPTAVIYSQVVPGGSDFDSAAILLYNGVRVGPAIPGVTFLSTGPRLATLGAGGVRPILFSPGFSAGPPIPGAGGWADIETDQNRIYGENSLILSFNGTAAPNALPWGILEPDPGSGRVFVMNPNFPGVSIGSYRSTDLALLNSVIYPLPGGPSVIGNLTRWGADGFVFRSPQYVHLFRSSLIPVTSGDRDGDRMDDQWEAENGLNPNLNDAADDFDGDGATNFQEMLAGTLPNDAQIRFEVKILGDGPSGVSISFQAIGNRRYQILKRDSLTSGDWEIVSEETGDRVINKSIAFDAGARYYAVRLVP